MNKRKPMIMVNEAVYERATYGADMLARGDDFNEVKAIRKVVNEHRKMAAALNQINDLCQIQMCECDQIAKIVQDTLKEE